MTTTLTIGARYCGPPGSGNGGYAAGLVAATLTPGPDEAIEVTLRAPAPLDTALAVAVDEIGGEAVVTDPSDPRGPIIAAARRVGWVEPTPPPGARVDPGEAAAAPPLAGFVDDHPFPGCFVCGPGRAEGDGLRLFAARVPGTAVFAVAWTPDAGDLALVWAALDCPSSFPMYLEEDPFAGPCVLGRITARVERRPEPGATTVVTAWREGVDGRKLHTVSMLHDASGERLAAARATWIRLAATP